MPEEREHRPEAGDVRERVSHGQPARRPGAGLRAGDRDGGQLAEIRRHERQDARREEADHAGGEAQQGSSGPSWPPRLRRPGRRAAGGGAWRRSSRARAASAELDDRDRGEVGALPGRIGLDVALEERGGGEAADAARSASRASRMRRASRRTGRRPGREYRIEVGEGSGRRSSSRPIVREGAARAPRAAVGRRGRSGGHSARNAGRGAGSRSLDGPAVRWWPRPRSSVDRARPS